WLVELDSISEPALVLPAVASVLGVREERGRSLQETLVAALQPRKMLLVLDTCERLVDQCAKLADALIRACPRMRILATSRHLLNVPGEQAYLVPALSVPGARQIATAESIGKYDAARLFIDRASAANPSFRLTDDNAHALAKLCSRLDGMPLAIELAAARVRALTVEELNERVDSR